MSHSNVYTPYSVPVCTHCHDQRWYRISPIRDYPIETVQRETSLCVLSDGRSQMNPTSVGGGSVVIAMHLSGVSNLPRTVVVLCDYRSRG
jgi:hypothetical protein